MVRPGEGRILKLPYLGIIVSQDGLSVCDGDHRLFVMKKSSAGHRTHPRFLSTSEGCHNLTEIDDRSQARIPNG